MFNIFKKEIRDVLITTTTGELFIPTRVYYKIHNLHLFKKALRKLKCIQFLEEDSNCFTIAYYKEAKKLNLATHYQDVPEELYPISLANCCIKTNSVLHMDSRSLKRAIELINFLVKHIPSNLIEVISFAHMNKLSSVKDQSECEGLLSQDYNTLFDDVICDEDHGLYDKIKSLDSSDDLTAEQINNLKSKALEAAATFIEEEERNNYPDAEKFSIKYDRANHRELIYMLTLKAIVKEKVAYKHYEGYKDYTSLDAIEELINQTDSSKSPDLSTNL